MAVALVAHSSNQGVGYIAIVVIIVAVVYLVRRASARRSQVAAHEALEPAKKLAYEDVTALGEQLQTLDVDMAGKELDDATRADYQRGLDAYEASKVAADSMTSANDISNVTRVLDDGRYAIACVRARVAGEALPARRCRRGVHPASSTRVTASRLVMSPGCSPTDRCVTFLPVSWTRSASLLVRSRTPVR